MLAKALRPPPDRYHGMGDQGSRYRYRELDLLANERTREMFFKRTKMIEAIHDFLRSRGFTQVETPMLQTLAGGAASRPFVTHHNALDIDVYLRISVELYLNRCIVGGLENIYDLGRAFRNEGLSHRHSPEFTILEWMMSYADYWDVAKMTEDLAESVALQTLGTTKVEQYDGQVIDFATPWRRITLQDAIKDAVGIDFLQASNEQLLEVLDGAADPDATWAKLVDAVYVKHVEPTLYQPTHVFDFPVDLFPICKRHPEDPRLSEHFDSVIRGMEILSGDTELNDPLDQHERFVDPAPAGRGGGRRRPAAAQRRGVRAGAGIRHGAHSRRRTWGRPPADGAHGRGGDARGRAVSHAARARTSARSQPSRRPPPCGGSIKTVAGRAFGRPATAHPSTGLSGRYCCRGWRVEVVLEDRGVFARDDGTPSARSRIGSRMIENGSPHPVAPGAAQVLSTSSLPMRPTISSSSLPSSRPDVPLIDLNPAGGAVSPVVRFQISGLLLEPT